MRLSKHERPQSTRAFRLFITGGVLLVLYLFVSLIYNNIREKEVCQEFVSLSGIAYEDTLLKEVGKLPGFQSISPVLEIPVRLQMGDYTAECTLYGVNLEELGIPLKVSQDVSIGAAPVLVLGQNSFASFTDFNGHGISEAQQKDALKNYRTLSLNYAFQEEQEDSVTKWRPCVIAGILTGDSSEIYMPYSQAETLLSQPPAIHTVLLTIRGKENMQRAESYFFK